ncbi:hypothetical protein C8034_v000972 [Colletotrichum sidae]|uniref:Uncharacterized protein n=1 Tax=Colletotrichum sidae TaxID=1347389 RepID=A0A4R8SXC3_9PEZI|nr:hypothetical protein C8034_v000972 [Colletotrichum sidae]
MSFGRAIACRRLAARPLPRATIPFATQQRRNITNKPDDGDLGGPGGQEPVPSSSGASQSWPTLAAIAGAGVLVGSYLVHLTGKPNGSAPPPVKGGEFDKLADKVSSRK